MTSSSWFFWQASPNYRQPVITIIRMIPVKVILTGKILALINYLIFIVFFDITKGKKRCRIKCSSNLEFRFIIYVMQSHESFQSWGKKSTSVKRHFKSFHTLFVKVLWNKRYDLICNFFGRGYQLKYSYFFLKMTMLYSATFLHLLLLCNFLNIAGL